MLTEPIASPMGRPTIDLLVAIRDRFKSGVDLDAAVSMETRGIVEWCRARTALMSVMAIPGPPGLTWFCEESPRERQLQLLSRAIGRSPNC